MVPRLTPYEYATAIPRAAALALVLALALAGCNGHDDTAGSPTPPPHLGGAAPTSLPVTISNQSSRTAYVLITGDPSQTFTVSPATTATILAGGSTVFNVTNISAGRIYVSYDVALSSSAPDGANPGDADYHTRFDKVELTYNQGLGGSANLTAVDFYAIPMVLQTSIQGTVINQLTLAPGQTGNGVQAALTGAAASGQSAPVVNTKAGSFARILSPVKAPTAYGKFDGYIGTLGPANTTFTIAGTFFGTTSKAYSYTGAVGTNNITLTSADGLHVMKIPLASLEYNATDLVNDNGIYTCNAPYTVDGTAHHVADNDIYAAVYRDLVAGFNLGFVQPGTNTSSTWWTSPAFPVNSYSGTTYNAYAQAVATTYPGAYGFPFSDRYQQVLADLGGMVDGMTVTLLGDSATPPANPTQGTVNPQTSVAGAPTINVVLVTTDDNFNLSTFNLDLQTFQGGTVNYFPPATQTPTVTTSSTAQVNGLPSQNGINIYTLQLRGQQYSILANVSNGTVVWASIAGGGNATWSAPNLFVGGLD